MDKKEEIHEITAAWLFAKLKYSGEQRMIIQGKKLLTWEKDNWGDEKPTIYKFLGFCQNKYAFKIECLGKKCGWSHRRDEES